MNRLLIGILDLLNKLLAIILVVSSTISGFYGELASYGLPVYDGPGHRIVMTIIGFIIGLILAALVSGVLATIITISREAAAIHQLLLVRPIVAPPQRPMV